jgi:hypothetical protein
MAQNKMTPPAHKSRWICFNISIDLTSFRLSGPLLPPIPDIQDQRERKSSRKKNNGKNVDKSPADIQSGKCLDQKLQVGGRRIVKAEIHPHLPMPIRAGTVAKTVPNPQKKPGKSCQRQKDQVGQSRFFPDPSQEVEQDDGGVKREKKDVQESIHLSFLYQYTYPIATAINLNYT